MTRDDVIGVVCDIYEEYGIDEFGFDLFKLCKQMEINLIPYSSCNENVDLIRISEDAFCCCNSINNKYEIFYNDKIKPSGRIKFSIPHELGHIVFNHPLGNNYSVDEEAEANIFGNECYVPQAFIIYYGFKTKTDLMATFDITEGYAAVLLNKVKQRRTLRLSQNEQRLITIFENNRNKNDK